MYVIQVLYSLGHQMWMNMIEIVLKVELHHPLYFHDIYINIINNNKFNINTKRQLIQTLWLRINIDTIVVCNASTHNQLNFINQIIKISKNSKLGL